jgi:hypothetical protein
MYIYPSASTSSPLSNQSPLCIRTHILLESVYEKERKKEEARNVLDQGRERRRDVER